MYVWMRGVDLLPPLCIQIKFKLYRTGNILPKVANGIAGCRLISCPLSLCPTVFRQMVCCPTVLRQGTALVHQPGGGKTLNFHSGPCVGHQLDCAFQHPTWI